MIITYKVCLFLTVIKAAVKLASPTGGRITVFQHILPTLGPGALSNRENAATSADKKNDSSLLGPVTDFYKKLALDCSGMQVNDIIRKFLYSCCSVGFDLL